MGSASGINTRRYHGHLIAATDPPVTRVRLLAGIEGFAEAEGETLALSSNRYPDVVYPEGYKSLQSFTVGNCAEWLFKGTHLVVRKTLAVQQSVNTSVVTYKNEGQTPVRLNLRPLVCHQFYHSDFYFSPNYPADLEVQPDQTVVAHDGVKLMLLHAGAEATELGQWYYNFQYPVEAGRGLNSSGDLFCPCELVFKVAPGNEVQLIATTEEDPSTHRLVNAVESSNVLAKLTAAAEKFLVQGQGRSTVIAGYPWFTDWGRDTMISLPGLCLCTGRVEMARAILGDFGSRMHLGLIPNRFVEAGEDPAYNTVDATLWFVNAVFLTLEKEWDAAFARLMQPVLRDIYDWHMRGTLFGIGIDPADGLLRQSEKGIQCTWMDAKIGDWVVTPRNGKAVEICGLWLNALRVMEWLANRLGTPSAEYTEATAKGEQSFLEKFWCEEKGYFYDTIDPCDDALRPNQAIAMSISFSAITPERGLPALAAMRDQLLTPVGLRTLAPTHPHYKGRFRGGLPELDAAYHQGTVWPWLMAPYLFASMRLTGSSEEARKLLGNADGMLEEWGLGGIAEVYDGDEPRLPGGCPWQAWSVAEYLRIATELEIAG